MSESPISNVSDTARWVAVYRARDSARPDALFHDPFAQLLAGERGQALARDAYSIGNARGRAISTLAVDFEVVRILA